MNKARRRFLAFAAGVALLPGGIGRAAGQPVSMSRMTAYGFTFPGLDGHDILLAEHAGKPILIVNTASQCGYTPQFTGLQQLWARYRDRGLLIVGVPSNDFAQEPGDAAAIDKTAHGEYGVSFPLAGKVAIKGTGAHPFYKWAAAERPLETPRWNFHKYLIGRDGHIAKVFPSEIEPMDARVIAAIEKELGLAK
jgi:glutathione peroxidase